MWAGYTGDKECGLKDGPVDSKGLWYIQRSKNEGKYDIVNYAHPDRVLAQWGEKGSDWGTYTNMGSGVGDWILVPRFQVKFEWYLVFEADNRENTNSVERTENFTVGVTLTKSSTISTQTELMESMKYAVSAGIAVEGVGEFGESLEVESSITNTMNQSMTSQVVKNWSKQEITKFVVPAGKDFRVKAMKTTFTSPCPGDDMELLMDGKHFKVEESSQKLGPLNE